MVAGKIANCRSVLLRGVRDSQRDESKELLAREAKMMLPSIDSVRRSDDVDQIRGYEGEAAARYFRVLPELVNDSDSGFRFDQRSRRPPLDPMNALLSFLYAMLSNDVRSACETTGLDAAVGYLHRDRSGRPGLALDLMEEFRSFFCDRLALSLVNRRQVNVKGFTTTESGAVRMNDDTRKAVLTAYQKRKQDTIEHPFLGEKTTVGLLVHLQARLMARHLRGDLDEYPAFIWR